MNNNNLIATRHCRENCHWLSSVVLCEHPRGTILDIRIFSDKSGETLQWANGVADSLLHLFLLFQGQSGHMRDRELNWVTCGVLFQNCISVFLWRPLPAQLLTGTKEEAERNCISDSELIHWSGIWTLILCNGLSKNIHKIYNLTELVQCDKMLTRSSIH